MNRVEDKFAVGGGQQRGVSLVVVLLILIIVSLLGAGAAQMALMAERTTRADRDYQVAFQAAEAALEDAISDIKGPNTSSSQRMSNFTQGSKVGFAPDCGAGPASLKVQGLCLPNAELAKPVWATVDFTDASNTAKTVEFGTFTGRTLDTGSGLQPAKKPRYVIEVFTVKSTNDISYAAVTAGTSATVYRITAMGFGPNVNSQVVLQSEFQL